MENQTEVTEFILLGLSSDPQVQIFLFLLFFVIYIITFLGNMMIMLVIRADTLFCKPMYFFLFHLSLVDICYSSATVPQILVNSLEEHKTISVNGCLTQIFFFSLAASTEIFILSAMAYDRYAAICEPLRYVETMSKAICVELVSGAWAIGFLQALLNTIIALRLHFCGPNQISHFSCELPALVQLSCTVTLSNQVLFFTSILLVGLSAFFCTLVSYIHIISTILRIRSAEGRCKAFSTCSSHLIAVGLFYLTGFIRYIKPSSVSSVVLDEILSIQYSILTPMLNPIIYSLRNKEVKTALGNILVKFK